MSKDKRTYRRLSEEEMLNYLDGEVRGKDAHETEHFMLSNPFEQEAMDGLEALESLQAKKDLEFLRQQVRTRSSKSYGWAWMKIAATVALLVAAVAVVWQYLDVQTGAKPVVMKEERASDLAEEDSFHPIVPDEGKGVLEKKDESPKTLKEKKTPGFVLEESPATTDELSEVLEKSQVAKVEKVEESMITPIAPRQKALVKVSESVKEDEDITLTKEPVELPEDTHRDAVVFEMADQEGKDKKRAMTKSVEMMNAAPVQSVTEGITEEKTSGIIKGRVLDEDGQPLPGVSVVQKGTPKGTVSDLEGHYQISTTDENAVLSFSFVGMNSAEVAVEGKSEIDVVMESDVTSLSEVVVTGYGVSEKRNVAGAVSAVDTKELQRNYQKPVPSGGFKAFEQYLGGAVEYPERAIVKGIEGKVVLKITVAVSGEIIDVEVKKGLGFGCDEEAVRLIQEGPAWQPAKQDGQPVEETVRVVVNFKLP